MDCFYSLMAFGAMLMALIALIKSSGFGEVREMHKRLRLEVEELRKRLLEAERLIAALRKGQLVPEKVEQVPAIKQEAIPIPVAPQPATPPPLPSP